ncbi:hypothetical protein [uncultured Methylobacterium sp.]|uniref:hypothetical protein n=1 Tax=uncultured Methylobacterium sp. TaxID=157278 RepID=UPI0035CA1B9F
MPTNDSKDRAHVRSIARGAAAAMLLGLLLKHLEGAHPGLRATLRREYADLHAQVFAEDPDSDAAQPLLDAAEKILRNGT